MADELLKNKSITQIQSTILDEDSVLKNLSKLGLGEQWMLVEQNGYSIKFLAGKGSYGQVVHAFCQKT